MQDMPTKPTLWDQLEEWHDDPEVDPPRAAEADILASLAISTKRVADALTRIVEELIKGERGA